MLSIRHGLGVCYGPHLNFYRSLATTSGKTVAVNGRVYQLPEKHKVGICFGGTNNRIFELAQKRGLLPNWTKISSQKRGVQTGLVATGVPTFGLTNDISILTGVESNVHGIPGRSFFIGNEKYNINDCSFLTADSCLSAFQKCGIRTGIISNKDYLLNIAGNDLSYSRALFSNDKCEGSWKSSLKLLNSSYEYLTELIDISDEPIVLYISISNSLFDDVSPFSPEFDAFYSEFDKIIGKFDKPGIDFAVSFSHGLNEKIDYNDDPRVVNLETVLPSDCIVNIPSDSEHLELGSFANVYFDQVKFKTTDILTSLRNTKGVETALSKSYACELLNLPKNRVGDIIVFADTDTAFGKTVPKISSDTLFSSGGINESYIPMMVSKELKESYSKKLGSGKARSFDMLDYLCNGLS